MMLSSVVLAYKTEPAGVTQHGCWTSYKSPARSKAVIQQTKTSETVKLKAISAREMDKVFQVLQYLSIFKDTCPDVGPMAATAQHRDVTPLLVAVLHRRQQCEWNGKRGCSPIAMLCQGEFVPPGLSRAA